MLRGYTALFHKRDAAQEVSLGIVLDVFRQAADGKGRRKRQGKPVPGPTCLGAHCGFETMASHVSRSHCKIVIR